MQAETKANHPNVERAELDIEIDRNIAPNHSAQKSNADAKKYEVEWPQAQIESNSTTGASSSGDTDISSGSDSKIEICFCLHAGIATNGGQKPISTCASP